jgi:exopolyphosphatase/guanosine-5'-triphosphate,3'-diphosphate pyrophosphatase
MGGINNGLITEAGVARALTTLRKFKTIIDQWRPDRVLAIGTSALRNARNGAEVVRLIEEQTGIAARIISGQEEADLIYRGVAAAVPWGEAPALVVDIGGGSVEFIIGTEHQPAWRTSLEIGGQRLLEMFQQHDPILPSEVEALKTYLAEKMEPVLAQLRLYQPRTLVGSSGTFDTLSEIYCHRHGLPYRQDDRETPFRKDAFPVIYHELLQKNRTQRLQIPGMIELRVDMIVVACCLIDFLLENYPFADIRVSTWSLKEGVLVGNS